jgi:hypothetical protein
MHRLMQLLISYLTPNPSQNTTATTTGTGVTDFKTLRDQYLAQWQQLNFQSSFDTFVEPYSSLGYGIYQEHPSNIFIQTRQLLHYMLSL